MLSTRCPKGRCRPVHSFRASLRISMMLLMSAHMAASGKAEEKSTTVIPLGSAGGSIHDLLSSFPSVGVLLPWTPTDNPLGGDMECISLVSC
ncbi:hypothetical protein CRUP_008652 [Coryphaenoides rupestris]|nr:hypothetical protein CRUP_008652 [Coryphaenoides rupestris]